MKLHIECIPCLLDQCIKVSKLLKLNTETANKMMKDVLIDLGTKDFKNSPPFLSKSLWKVMSKYAGTYDIYKDIKEYYNKELIQMENEIKTIIKNSSNKLYTALKVAISGNIIDFGAKVEFNKNDILKKVREINKHELTIDNSTLLFDKLKDSNTLLYLGDNCGEIVFDKIFIEELKKNYPNLKIYFAIRGNPVLNDITIIDAEMVGMNEIVEVISNGDSAPGTIINDCSDEFRKIFFDSSVIISKGQGNYETLFETEKENIFFLFMTKCDYVANTLNVNKLNMLCVKHKKI